MRALILPGEFYKKKAALGWNQWKILLGGEACMKCEMTGNEWWRASPLLSSPPRPSGRSQGAGGRGSGSSSRSTGSVQHMGEGESQRKKKSDRAALPFSEVTAGRNGSDGESWKSVSWSPPAAFITAAMGRALLRLMALFPFDRIGHIYLFKAKKKKKTTTTVLR